METVRVVLRAPGAASALVLACAVVACACSSGAGGSDPARAGASGAGATTGETAERVVGWTRGTADRGPRPRASNTRLLTLPAGQPIAAGTLRGPCVRATMFLPGPPRDPRIFLLVDDRLVFQDPRGPEPNRIVELAVPDRFGPRRIESLLAFSRAGLPVELLVSARRGERSPTELWVLDIAAQAVERARPVEAAAVRTREAFFARFDAPRCKRDDRRCLRIGQFDGETTLYEEVAAGRSRRSLQRLGDVDVRDAAWTPAARTDEHDATLYLLVPCPAQGG